MSLLMKGQTAVHSPGDHRAPTPSFLPLPSLPVGVYKGICKRLRGRGIAKLRATRKQPS
jgi:hypothetical protein